MLHYDFRVYSVSSRNESSGIFLEVKHGWWVRLTTLLPSVNWMSTKCACTTCYKLCFMLNSF
jgi:hypothetical protein